jgi:hypothetical protein
MCVQSSILIITVGVYSDYLKDVERLKGLNQSAYIRRILTHHSIKQFIKSPLQHKGTRLFIIAVTPYRNNQTNPSNTSWFMINLIPIRRPLDPAKPLFQMPSSKLSFKRHLPQPKTVHSPLNLPIRINPRRVIITMLPPSTVSPYHKIYFLNFWK